MEVPLVHTGSRSVNHFNKTGDTAKLGHCLHYLLEDAAEKYPTNLALVCDNTTLTYRDLNEAANRLARVLISLGVGRHDLVGVAIDRSAYLVVTLFAVLKIGAAYVPLDAAFPSQRIKHMLDVAAPKLLVITAGTLSTFESWAGVILSVDEEKLNVTSSAMECSNLQVDVHPQDLAYVIFTSGSTGKPKGVEITHGALCNLLLSMREVFDCEEAERLLAVTTVTFDIAALELFMPLLSGAATVIAKREQVKDVKALRGLLERHAITMMQATPASWQMLLESGWKGSPALRKLLCGGEAMPATLAARLLECGDSLWNLYGPTEATVWAAAWQVRHGEDIIIGQPLANYQLYLLDEQLTPVLPGQYGELYIGGPGLARGYHKNPELTQASFIDNPFTHGRMYRTGDIGCFSKPDKLSISGRADSQIKVRGYRIELGDVEAALAGHPQVIGAVVICRQDQLIAYFTWRAGSKKAETNAGAKCNETAALRKWLGQSLPPYMVPAFFVQIEAFPMTLNNKIDRKALPDPLADKTPVKLEPQSPTPSSKPAAASTSSLERHILAVWSRVLGVTRIGTKDNFFHLGGNSMRVVQVQVQLEKLLNRSIPIAKLFEHYSIESLAGYLGGKDAIGVHQYHMRRCLPSASEGEERIAVVSMACRLPGGVCTPEELWKLLRSGRDAITDVPSDRWNAAMLQEAGLDTGQLSECLRGGFLRCIDSFDIALFGISPQEAREMDPLQLLTLETCWEGLERAGYPLGKLRGSRTGVYIGISNMPAHQNFARPLANLNGYTATGSAGATISGRISHILGLEGPSLTVDTACSSSLVTTDLACTALRRGECDLAVSSGTTLMLTPGLHVEFSRLGGISRDGRCRAFSEDTDGTGWAEGSVAVVLKRLSDARRDGDTIHAIVCGSAVNHGGRSAGLTTPSGPAQQQVIQNALMASRLQPTDIDYIEAHGTGTKLGDPIEGMALAQVFGGSRSSDTETNPLWIGSIKSNIGHTQAAAGLVGVLKVVLALQHQILPQTLHVSQPTSAVDWRGAGMALLQEDKSWIRQKGGRLRRAGVSSFGIGGTNAHVVVSEVEETIAAPESVNGFSHADSMPFLVSGNTNAALVQQVERLRCYLSKDCNLGPQQLGNVAYSLATTRTHFKNRLVFMADGKSSLLDQLAAATMPHGTIAAAAGTCAGQDRIRLAMLFTGQGSQIPGMGRDLSRTYPVFCQSLETTAKHFSLERPLLEIMWADADNAKDVALLNRTDFAQPAIFTLQVALLSLWRSWGIEPGAVLGHSLGEYASAYAAGVFDLASACRLVEARARLMQGLPSGGNMVSLEASAREVAAIVGSMNHTGRVGIAAHNTPTQTVISGDVSATGPVAAHFSGLGRKVKALDVSHAFHSHHIDHMLADFEAVLAEIDFHPPQIPVVSGLTGRLTEPGSLEAPQYWVSQTREAVHFSDAMQAMSSLGIDVFIELGPRPVLSGMGAACLGADQRRLVSWLPSLVARKSGVDSVQDSLGKLHKLGVSVDWSGYFKPFGFRRVELPTYAFQRKRVLSLELPRVPKPHNKAEGTENVSRERTAHGPDSSLGVGLEVGLGSLLTDASVEKRTTLVQGTVRKIVANLVGIESSDSIDINLAWQDIGIDSLMEPQFRSQLASLTDSFTDTPLPTNVTSTHPNLSALCDYLLSLLPKQRQSGLLAGTEIPSTLGMRPLKTGKAGSNVTFAFDNVIDIQWPPKSVLIIGATGFLGAVVLQQLLERGITTAYCLVREADGYAPAMDRLESSLKKYDIWKESYRGALYAVPGNMTRPNLGMSPADFRGMARSVDAICHVGALMDNSRSAHTVTALNSDITHEILRFASIGRGKSIYFISSSVNPQESLSRQADHSNCQQDRLTSMPMAESMVVEAWSRGAKACILRLPLAFASSETGHFNPRPDNFLHYLLAGSLLMGKSPRLHGSMSRWMPVDYLGKAVAAAIMEHASLLNSDVIFTNTQALSFKDLCSTMLAACNHHEIVPLDQWRRSVLTLAVSNPTSQLVRLADILSQLTNQHIVELFNVAAVDKPSLDGHVWSDDIWPAPLIHETQLRKYIGRIYQETSQTNSVGVIASTQALKTAPLDCLPATESAASPPTKYPVALSPLRRVLCPSLDFYPPRSRLDRFEAASRFFNNIPWCSRLINEASPSDGPIPGHGQAVTFIPHCFNPASSRHEQFLGYTLSHAPTCMTNSDEQHDTRNANNEGPPLRHMLSLFRPSDLNHVEDPERPILRVSTLIAFGAGTSGYEGIVAGGLIATVLDESLSIVNELNSALVDSIWASVPGKS
ncbi:polyketide synthase [Cordyceps fumosorosea ARSEF 2679]|uniref:Polyketide synthase n=1 Tax=Cordyceps fumosorosea (strain ARSEF 2679) TaxID=1081104 RepID=A0A162JQU3_CORFA|nr:polyketide synthase [Cordyceps fumosorosea ARSEF 2679]OAA72442.1 polyketide synthase [Cordyceps fumosorosea ARSEF 2679]